MELIIVAIIISLISYYLLKRPKLNLPPGPKPWPVVGNLNGLKPVLFKCFNEWAQTYGPIISVWYGSSLNIVVSNSDLAKQVLKEHDQVLANRHRMRAQETVNENEQDLTWADYGPHYVKVRKMCTLELFSVKKTEALKPVREDEVGAMIHSIYKDCTNNSDEKLGKSLVLRKYLGEVALNTITRLVLGKRFVNLKGDLDEHGQEFKAIVADGRRLIGASMMGEYVPLLRLLMPSHDRKMKDHKARMDRFAEQIMEHHTKARLENGDTKHHFVDTLLSLKDQYELTNETVIGLLWNLIIAGMDTTAIAVEWAMAELMRDPKALQKAQEELDQTIGLERKMTEDDIHALPYLQAVIKEALRLHPPTPLMLPHCAKAQIKIDGYDIPKGAVVHVNVWAINRDPENWPNPTQFKPERFIESDVDLKGSDFKLLPFGAGRRVCIGAQLGIKLATSMLGCLLHNFNWSPPKGVKPEEINVAENDSVFVTYMATPLRAQPIPRLSSHLYKWVPSDV